MDTYRQRLATFRQNNWPHSKKKPAYEATPEKLAQAGFFFRPLFGSIDNVCCYLCNKNLDGWQSTDSAWREHQSHAPQCPLVGLGELKNRIKTFSAWPHCRVDGLSAESAGFFHYPRDHRDDTAICFQCGVSLDGWEPADSPWHEHERRRPHCPFLVTGGMRSPAAFGYFLAMESDDLACKTMLDAAANQQSAYTKPVPAAATVRKSRRKAGGDDNFKVPMLPPAPRPTVARQTIGGAVDNGGPKTSSKRASTVGQPENANPNRTKRSRSTIRQVDLIADLADVVGETDLDLTVGQFLQNLIDRRMAEFEAQARLAKTDFEAKVTQALKQLE